MKRKIASLILALAAVSAVGGLQAQQATCEQACSKYKSCTVDMWKKAGRNLTKEQNNALMPGCMKTCNNPKMKPQVLACYGKAVKATGDACMAYWTCVSQLAQAQSGKK